MIRTLLAIALLLASAPAVNCDCVRWNEQGATVDTQLRRDAAVADQ